MTASPELPWSRINDFLLEVGAARNSDEFGRRVLLCLHDLIPYDANGFFASNDGTGRMCIHVTFAEAWKWIELYNNYYWKAQPPLPSSNTIMFDWRQSRHTEYATDFISPQGIGFSLTIYHLQSMNHNIGGLVINRSKNSSGFSEQDRLIMEVIQPHLSNLNAMHTMLDMSGISQLPDAATLVSDYQCLTKREAEIAALICRKVPTGMIATRLMISPMTVYRHVANIFSKLNVFNRDELVEKLLSSYVGESERKAL